MNALETYKTKLQEAKALAEKRDDGNHDDLLDELDELWKVMTLDEQKQAGAFAAALIMTPT